MQEHELDDFVAYSEAEVVDVVTPSVNRAKWAVLWHWRETKMRRRCNVG
jgi:hypothetical protein